MFATRGYCLKVDGIKTPIAVGSLASMTIYAKWLNGGDSTIVARVFYNI